ncbi:phage terminase large subunit family protein [Treponema primitia]|uniref:terminase gpA endonuclease subunit n=1 Tax=Treponema primitia TaxID=88058 RepID=UPI00398064AF
MTDTGYLLDITAKIPKKRPVKLISEYVEGRRVMPLDSPFPGPWRNELTPYGIEIQNCLSPYSPVHTVVVKKPRKVGMTAIMDNVVLYWIGEMPTKILYSTSSQDLAEEWSSGEIEEAISSMGLRDRIIAKSYNAKAHRSGSQIKFKEYTGGRLDIVSAAAMTAKRQKNIRVLICDEVSGTKKLLASGEGSWVEVLSGHTKSWGARAKRAFFSSPTVKGDCLISEMYEDGTCEEFLIPCPYCGEYIPLRLITDPGLSWGLKADTQGGEIKTAYYVCPECGEHIHDYQKKDFYSYHPHCIKKPTKELKPAFWKATKTPADPYYRSFGLNSLYAPLGMVSFTDCYKERAKAEAGGPDAMRSFMNLFAGEAFEEVGETIKISNFNTLRGNWPMWQVPSPHCLYLTMGCDVQWGSAKDKNNPPRLEVTIIGTGIGYRKWFIGTRVFLGPTENAYAGAFERIWEWIVETKLTFPCVDGTSRTVEFIIVDAGDAADARDVEVCRFVQRLPPGSAAPAKGFGQLKADTKKGEQPDLPYGNKRWRISKIGPMDEAMLEISTHFYKSALARGLSVKRLPGDVQQPQFHDFPYDLNDEQFQGLICLQKMPSGGWLETNPRHELLDTWVYADCASDYFLSGVRNNLVALRISRGVSRDIAEMTTSAQALEWYAWEKFGYTIGTSAVSEGKRLAEEAGKD